MRTNRALPALAAAWLLPAAALFVLRAHWLGDPVVDLGSELTLATGLNRGERLYFDHLYPFGPVGPYLEAAALRLGGPCWRSLLGLNFAVLLATLAGQASLVRRLAGDAAAGASLLFASFLFAANQASVVANYNFLTPYRPALTIALALALPSLTLFLPARPPGKWPVKAWASGALAALCFLTKGEVFVALAGAVAATILLRGLARRPTGTLGPFFAAAAGVLALAVCGFSLLWGVSPLEAGRALLGPYLLFAVPDWASFVFYRRLFGWHREGLLSLTAVVGAAFALLALLPLWLIRRASTAARATVVAGVFGSACLVLRFFNESFAGALPLWETLSPFLALAVAALAAARSLRGKEPEAWLDRFAVSVFAVLLCLRVLFAAWSVNYGFALALPACTLVFVALFRACPRWQWRAYLAVPLVLQALFLSSLTDSYVERKTVPLPWPSAPFRYYASLSAPILLLEEHLRTHHAAARSLTVLPEGNIFNFALGKAAPARFYSLLPDQYLLYGDAFVIGELARSRADLIVLYPRPMLEEFAAGDFRNGYGRAAYEWIRAHYLRDPTESPALREAGVEVWLAPAYQPGNKSIPAGRGAGL